MELLLGPTVDVDQLLEVLDDDRALIPHAVRTLAMHFRSTPNNNVLAFMKRLVDERPHCAEAVLVIDEAFGDLDLELVRRALSKNVRKATNTPVHLNRYIQACFERDLPMRELNIELLAALTTLAPDGDVDIARYLLRVLLRLPTEVSPDNVDKADEIVIHLVKDFVLTRSRVGFHQSTRIDKMYYQEGFVEAQLGVKVLRALSDYVVNTNGFWKTCVPSDLIRKIQVSPENNWLSSALVGLCIAYYERPEPAAWVCGWVVSGLRTGFVPSGVRALPSSCMHDQFIALYTPSCNLKCFKGVTYLFQLD